MVEFQNYMFTLMSNSEQTVLNEDYHVQGEGSH